ncbi:MAG: hypothetical protein SVZ03_03910 [Spirochaetota bacterium]|nr:hypothetical protein [Spirochaetota bacterium]
MNRADISDVKFFTWIIVCIIMTFGFMNNRILYADGLATIDYNYINDLIGDRATGMGGAYTAISDDPSGAYYNPAGLVFAFDNQISLSVNSYKERNIKFEKAVADKPYTQDISSFYPSFFGIVQSLGSFKLAVTIINMNNEILDQDDYFPGISIQGFPAMSNINYNLNDNTLLGGISLAHFINDSISVGVTAYGLRRRTEQILNQLTTVDATDSSGNPITYYQILNNYITEVIYGSVFEFGMQYMPMDRLCFGSSVTMGVIFSHDYEQQYFKKDINADSYYGYPYIYMTWYDDKIDVDLNDDKLPMVIRVGTAYFPTKRITISADIIAHIGNKYYHNSVNDTYNGAVGVEYFVTNYLPVRLGFFTNFANTPKIKNNITGQPMHVDMYGYSMSLGWQTKSSSISLSGFLQTGTGKAQIISESYEVQDAKIWAYSISLTGSARY